MRQVILAQIKGCCKLRLLSSNIAAVQRAQCFAKKQERRVEGQAKEQRLEINNAVGANLIDEAFDRLFHLVEVLVAIGSEMGTE